jgi:hypothetical protein
MVPENPGNKPKITFPCQYPIKVIGRAGDHFDAEIIAAINPFLDKPFEGTVQHKDSNEKNFTSVTITLFIQEEEQLTDIFQALKKNPNVLMVL